MECDVAGTIGRRWTYVGLLADAERLALALLTRYAPGERIAVWAPNLPEWVILEYAAALAGLTLVTANPAYKARELRYVLTQSRSRGLFMTGEYRGNRMDEIAHEVVQNLPQIREMVDLANHAALFAECGPPPPHLPSVAPKDPVQIQYTSGTTGQPKGALLHHRGLVNNARFVFDRGRVRDGDTVLNFMPMFHTSGSSCVTLGCVRHGCRMIIAALFDPVRMLELIESERVDALLGVPTMLFALSEAQAARPRDVSTLQLVISGGSTVPPELVRRVRTLFGCRFGTVYGQTEASPVLTQTFAYDSDEDLCETVGRPLPQTEIAIRDPATGEVVGIGVVGEICSRGYCNMLGYNDDHESTARAIDADGWLRTGDLGTMDARGYVRVTARVKEMIIRGGENLFPAEIENVLLEHPDVAEVAVIGAPDERWGEIVICFLRLAPGAELDQTSLRAHCRTHLAPQKTPARWITVESWPLTGSGKIQKFVLRDRFVAGAFADPIEAEVVEEVNPAAATVATAARGFAASRSKRLRSPAHIPDSRMGGITEVTAPAEAAGAIQLSGDSGGSARETWELIAREAARPASEIHRELWARNVRRGSLNAFRPRADTATGSAMIVLPGGAFLQLAMEREGFGPARWLQDRGIAAFVLKYRVAQTAPDPALAAAQIERRVQEMAPRLSNGEWLETFQTDDEATARRCAVEDATEAIRIVRSRAQEFGLDAPKIGVLGFSAGARIALELALTPEPDARPDIVAAIYGASPKDTAVPTSAPPAFVAAASDDFTALHCLRTYEAWRTAGSRAELHIFENGGHGFGLLEQGASSDRWVKAFEHWLRAHQFLDRPVQNLSRTGAARPRRRRRRG